MKITDIEFVKVLGGFFFDDQAAVREGRDDDGFTYAGNPMTPGFYQVRMPAEAISVVLCLENGATAYGDCVAVQYSGTGGRDPVFLAGHYLEWMEAKLKPILAEMDALTFQENADVIEGLKDHDGNQIHAAIRYGVSQALLEASARARGDFTVTETVCEEYKLELVPESVKVFGQTGDDRYNNADKMILKRVDVLPHALINNVEAKVGEDGKILADYIGWLAERVRTLRIDESYNPEFHLDLYGTLGLLFKNDLQIVADYCALLAERAAPFQLRLEGPIDMGSRDAHIDGMAELRVLLDAGGRGVQIVADEWCNTREDIELFAKARAGHMLQIKPPDLGGINQTIEAVLFCRDQDVLAYQGGSCTETDQSARICTQVALATRPYQILAKPGMGFDEGYMVVNNEMMRTLAIMKNRKSRRGSGYNLEL